MPLLGIYLFNRNDGIRPHNDLYKMLRTALFVIANRNNPGINTRVMGKQTVICSQEGIALSNEKEQTTCSDDNMNASQKEI